MVGQVLAPHRHERRVHRAHARLPVGWPGGRGGGRVPGLAVLALLSEVRQPGAPAAPAPRAPAPKTEASTVARHAAEIHVEGRVSLSPRKVHLAAVDPPKAPALGIAPKISERILS